MIWRAAALCLILAVCVPTARMAAATYYISSGGDDTNSGRSAAYPFKSISKLNAFKLGPGDKVFLRGGDTIKGTLYLEETDAGSAAQPIEIRSYGSGKAIWTAEGNVCFYAYNAAGISIRDIVFYHAPYSPHAGVQFYSDRADTARLPFIRLNNLEISGFREGLSIGTWSDKGGRGYRDVIVSRCTFGNNLITGASVYGNYNDKATHSNVTFQYCNAHDNYGDSSFMESHSGNGIVLGSIRNGLITHCRAWENGKWCRSPIAGPAGLWFWNSDSCAIEYSESHHNRRAGGVDGDGFDLDIRTTNSVIRYCYSHDNEGAGFLICNRPGYYGDFYNNRLCYNISINDRVGILLYGGMKNIFCYNNDVYQWEENSGDGLPATALLQAFGLADKAGYSENVLVVNNIFSTRAAIPFLITESLPAARHGAPTFISNLFDTARGEGYFWHNDTGYTSRAAASWGDSAYFGPFAANRIVHNVLPHANVAGTLTHIDSMRAALAGYKADSILPGAQLEKYLLSSRGTHDFFGRPLQHCSAGMAGAYDSFSRHIRLAALPDSLSAGDSFLVFFMPEVNACHYEITVNGTRARNNTYAKMPGARNAVIMLSATDLLGDSLPGISHTIHNRSAPKADFLVSGSCAGAAAATNMSRNYSVIHWWIDGRPAQEKQSAVHFSKAGRFIVSLKAISDIDDSADSISREVVIEAPADASFELRYTCPGEPLTIISPDGALPGLWRIEGTEDTATYFGKVPNWRLPAQRPVRITKTIRDAGGCESTFSKEINPPRWLYTPFVATARVIDSQRWTVIFKDTSSQAEAELLLLPGTGAAPASGVGEIIYTYFPMPAMAGSETIVAQLIRKNLPCFDTLSFTFHPGRVGIFSPQRLAQRLSVFPNPGTEIVTILSASADISIHNATGREILSRSVTVFPLMLDIKEWPSGVYVISSGGQSTRLIIAR